MSSQRIWTSLVESAASLSPQVGLASERSDSPKSSLTAAPCSKNIGPPSPTTETCEQFQLFDAISLPEVFPASRAVLPGSDGARTTTVTSGRQCATLLDDASPLGFVVRTCLESSAWNSTACFLTWRALATRSNRLLFRLVPSMPRTEGTGFGLWQTPVSDDAVEGENGKVNSRGEPKLSAQVKLWPTPTSRDHKDGTAKSCQNVDPNGLLGRVVHLFPTPRAADADKNIRTPEGRAKERLRRKNGEDLPTHVGGQLNPMWVEWLMGYPIGHTACEGWAIPSSRKLPTKS